MHSEARDAAPRHVEAKPERVEWIDRAKGLGIILVVIGHVTLSKELHHLIFLFHMPLFFALSGMLAKPRDMTRLWTSRWNGLIIPYCSFLVLIGVADILLSPLSGRPPVFAGEPLSRVLFRMVFGGSELGGVYGVFWYIPCLIAVSMLFNLLLKYRERRWLVVIVVLGIAAAGLLMPGHRNPQGLLAAPVALFFYWLGWMGLFREDKQRLVAAILILTLLLLFGHVGPFDMKYREFGLLPGNVEAACLGMLIVFAVARYGLDIPWVGQAVAGLGSASLTIMFVHQLIHFHMEGRFPEWIIMIAAILIPAGLHRLFQMSPLTRRFLRGESPDKAVREPKALTTG